MPKWYDENNNEVTDPAIIQRLEGGEGKPDTSEPGNLGYDIGSAIAGTTQGAALNTIEGLGQFIEHATGQKLAPQVVRDALKSWRDYGRSTTAGQVGELAGEVGSFAVPGLGLARGAGLISNTGHLAQLANRAAQLARNYPTLSGIVRGGVSAGLQPVEGEGDYWDQKKRQVTAGEVLGGSMVNPAGRKVLSNVATHLGVHAPWSLGHYMTGMSPWGWAGHIPLYHIARRAHSQIGPPMQRGMANYGTQRAAGALAGTALSGREVKDDIHIRSLTDPEYRSD